MTTSHEPTLVSEHRIFDGRQRRYRHPSTACRCEMHFSIFLPAEAEAAASADAAKLPALLWLSGLTCTDENFVLKAGAQRYAAERGMVLVAPDTSPRGEGVPDADGWDFGQGAGFYLDATRPPWVEHFRMQSYILEELVPLVVERFPIDGRRLGVSGHSMGGHGALTLAVRNPDVFGSVSALAPICAPMRCPWGRQAFRGYLGEDETTWRRHDAVELLRALGFERPILVDQGGDDQFLEEQLQPELLQAVCEERGIDLDLRIHPGYDHSYFFVASFIGDHIGFHDRALMGRRDGRP